jgi:hypothetical protein
VTATALETVAEIIGDEPEKAPGAFVPAVLEDTPELPPDGIHFGMPEELYHQLPALSAHGIRKLAGSPMNFWASTPWLSEKRRKAEQERALEERIHQIIGKAYHCRIMEGAEEFGRRFAVELAPEDCEGALVHTDEIKAAIANAGEKPVAKVPDKLPDGQGDYMRSAKKADWIAQLLLIDENAKILDVLNEQHRAKHRGKLFISAEAHQQIEIAARMIEHDPEVRHAFRDGYPEVVLIWHCPKTGVPMKARADYLKLKAIVDLKSIANQRERSLENAIRFEIASYNYNVQPAVYSEGVDAVRKLVREGKARIALWLPGLGHMHGPTIPAEYIHWTERWAKETECQWLWVFQQKGDAPVTRGVFYPLGGTTAMLTNDIVRREKKRFRQFSETFGCDPWLDVRPIYDLADEDVPASATEI